MMFSMEGDTVEKFYGITTDNKAIADAGAATKITLNKDMLGGLTFDGLKSGVRKDHFSYSVFIPMTTVPKYLVFGVAKGKVVAFYGPSKDAEGVEHQQQLPPHLLQGQTFSGR